MFCDGNELTALALYAFPGVHVKKPKYTLGFIGKDFCQLCTDKEWSYLSSSFHPLCLLSFYSHSSSAGTKPGDSESFRCSHDVFPSQAVQHSVSSAPHSHLQTHRQALLHSGRLHFTGKRNVVDCYLKRFLASAKFKYFLHVMGSRQGIRGFPGIPLWFVSSLQGTPGTYLPSQTHAVYVPEVVTGGSISLGLPRQQDPAKPGEQERFKSINKCIIPSSSA